MPQLILQMMKTRRITSGMAECSHQVSAAVSHFCEFSGAGRQCHQGGACSQGDGRDEKEDGIIGIVKQQPPSLCIATRSTFPFWRSVCQLWAESVPASESANSADSTHRTAGATPQLPSEPLEQSRRYACEEHQLCSYCWRQMLQVWRIGALC